MKQKKREKHVMMRCRLLLLLFFFTTYFHYSLADTVGSNTAPSLETFHTFPTATFNEIIGFAWMDNGFALQDSSTSCSWSAVFPVSGTINLNGGTLALNQDLFFNNITTLQGLGTILGNGNALGLCATITSLPNNTSKFSDIYLFLGNDVVITSSITFSGNCIIFGNGNSLILDTSGAIIIDSSSTFTLRDVTISGVSGTNIACADNTGILVLDNVSWIQSADASFDFGAIQFLNQVDFAGSYTFTYDSTQSSTIVSNSSWMVSDGLQLSIGRQQIVDYVEPLIFTDKSSQLKLDHASMLVTASGMGLTNGVMVIQDDVTLNMLGTSSTYGLIIGNNTSANDFTIQLNPSSALNINSGPFVYNNYSPTELISVSKSAWITRGQTSTIYVTESLTLPACTINITTTINPSTIIALQRSFSFNNTKIITPRAEVDLTGSQSSLGIFTIANGGSIFMSKGSFLFPTIVQGSGNYIFGTGQFNAAISLQDSNAQGTFGLVGQFLQNIAMNNGQIILGSNMFLGSSALLTGSGSVNISNYTCNFSSVDNTWTSTLLWQSSTGGIMLHAEVDLLGTWSFQGPCLVDGNNNVLNLKDIGSIFVMPNSTVTFKNIVIKGAANSNISCSDSSASIIFDKVTWVQDTSFSFTVGSFLIKNDVEFSGAETFNYSSNQTSTINANSQWLIDKGLTLSIGKQSSSGPQPLYFTDSTSQLFVNGASLTITSSGIQVINGTLLVDNDVNLDILGTDSSSGMIMGSGVAGQDFTLLLNPSAALNLNTGWLVYNNVSSDGFQSAANTAAVFEYPDSHVYIASSLTFPSLTADITSLLVPPATTASGVTLSYNNTRIVLPNAEYTISGIQSSPGSFMLNGNDSIFLAKGVLVNPVSVSGSNNTIFGTGNISNPITLQDNNAQLIIGLNGTVLENIVLNNGTLQLSSDCVFGNDISMTGSGMVNLENYNLILGSQELLWTSTIFWQGSNGSIMLNSDIDLSSTWAFQGDCIINGQGNTLDFEYGGNIIIGSNSTLRIKNARLFDLEATDIACTDSTSVLILDSVNWVQSNNFTFSVGALQIFNDVDMSGQFYTFAYQTQCTSTVQINSILMLDTNFTFSYDPIVIASSNLLQFIDKTSQLTLHGATLHATVTGLQLTTGKLNIVRSSFIENETMTLPDSSTLDNGITFGNNLGDDIICEIVSAALLNVSLGSLNYKNTSADSFIVDSDTSSLNMLANTALNLYQNLDINPGVIDFYENTILGRAPGADIIGSINLFGALTYVTLP